MNKPKGSDSKSREHTGAHHTAAYAKKSSPAGRTEPTGIVLDVKAWHAQAHATVHGVTQAPLPSANTLKSAKAYAASVELKQSLSPISIRMNAILDAAAPAGYVACCDLRNQLGSTQAYAASQNFIDPLVMQGRSVAYNRCTSCHKDTKGPPGELTGMICLAANPGMLRRSLLGVWHLISLHRSTPRSAETQALCGVCARYRHSASWWRNRARNHARTLANTGWYSTQYHPFYA